MKGAILNRLQAYVGTIKSQLSGVVGRRIMQDSLWISAGHATTILAGVLSIRIFTELVPASVFGAANLMIGMLTLGVSASLAPLAQTQIRYFMSHQQLGFGPHYTRLITKYAIFVVALLATLICATLIMFPALFASASLSIIAFSVLWVAAAAARTVLIGPVQAERRMQRYAAWITTEGVLLLTCTAGALVIDPSIEAFIAGQTLATSLAVAIFGRIPRVTNNEAIRPEMKTEVNAQIVRYGLPFLPFAVLGFLYTQSDRFVLVTLLDTAAVGNYVAAFAIASRIQSVSGAIMTDIFRPVLFEAETKRDLIRSQRVFRTWLGAMAGITLSAAICVYVFGNVIADILIAPPYRQGARDIMALVALGYAFNSVAQVVENRILSLGASTQLIWTKLAGGIANVACAFVFVPILGVLGAGLANAAGQAGMLIAVVIALLLTRRNYEAGHGSSPRKDAVW